jgi:hypothetical protein
MAREASARASDAAEPVLAELASWDDAAALFARPGIDADTVLVLGPEVELAAPVAAPDALWICVASEVRYVLDEPEAAAWRAVLPRLAPGVPLRDHLRALGLSLDDVRKYVDEALEFAVVTIA